MFGYLTPEKGELRIREYELYRGHYCGVCHAIRRRYGLIFCPTLTYDATLLALVGAIGSREGAREGRCVINPLKKVPLCRGEAVDYAADVNIYLAAGKLRDNWQDEKNILSGAGLLALKRAERKARRRLGKAADEADAQLQALGRLEKENCRELDAPALCSGKMLEALIGGCPAAENSKKALGPLGFNLGRWLYLLDALDDLEKDEKSGSYNVLLRCFGSREDALQNKERLEYNLLQSLAQAGELAELLPAGPRSSILLNVIDQGAVQKTRRVLSGGKKKQTGGFQTPQTEEE
jgi:hypothetical protein